MCGRTSCYCQPEIYQGATTYYDPECDKYVKPEWKQIDGHEFKPSTNIAPTEFTPVLIPGSFWNDITTKQALQPMMWGMIPPWHQGEYNTHGLSTNNCRIENIRSSKLYSPSLNKGKRCVIICDGFYEWKKNKNGQKQPYFVYSCQHNNMKIDIKDNWENAVWSENKGWEGPKVLSMAGIFNEWHSPSDEIIFNYTIITMEANSTLNWLHHRMPAILSSTDQINGWLDVEGTPVKDALDLLSPVDTISHYPVSTLVNNSRNKDSNCNKPVDLKVKSKSSALMESWLKGKKSSSDTNDTPNKKIKLG